MSGTDADEAAPFPVKEFRTKAGRVIPRSYVPMWMIRYVYAKFQDYYGGAVPLDHFRSNGGFEAMQILDFIAGGSGNGDAFIRGLKSKQTSRSVKGEVQLIVPGTPEYREAMREFASSEKEAREKMESNLGATGQQLRFYQR